MIIEQYRQMKKSQLEMRREAFEDHKEMKEFLMQKHGQEAANKRQKKYIDKMFFSNSCLKLPRTSLTRKLRAAFEDLILNDVAAVEGRCCNTCSMDYVNDLMEDMKTASGIEPSSFCFIHNQDIPDIRKGSFYLGWIGDVNLIKSILEKNGLKVTYQDENTKLLVEEK